MTTQTIKKYANRKLYHTNRKQYITLDGIAELIQAGEQVEVLDNETGADITASILTQVLQSRRAADRLPTQVLTGLIQAGGDTLAGVRRSVVGIIGGLGVVDAEIRRRLERLYAKGQIGQDELAQLQALLTEPSGDAANTEPSALPSYRDIVQLRDQVEALTAVVEQLLSEREPRATDS